MPRARQLARPGGGRHKAFPQDERGRAPLALPLGELHDVVVTERAALKRGFTKGSLRAGGTRPATDRAGRRDGNASPFGIRLYKTVPLPYGKG